MTQEAMNNAIVLFELGVERKDVEEAERIYKLTPELQSIFSNPTIVYREKQKLVQDIFEKEDFSLIFINFLKELCKNYMIDKMDEIFDYYYQYWDTKNRIINATLAYASEPEQDKKDEILLFLEQKYPDQKIQMKEEKRPELLGGFVLYVGHEEYDWSFDGSLKQLERKLTRR
ncbi:MAG: ATP synthase F1 subunit delta [Lachnospiraceae bacterium]